MKVHALQFQSVQNLKGGGRGGGAGRARARRWGAPRSDLANKSRQIVSRCPSPFSFVPPCGSLFGSPLRPPPPAEDLTHHCLFKCFTSVQPQETNLSTQIGLGFQPAAQGSPAKLCPPAVSLPVSEDLAHFFRGYDLLPQAIFFMRDAEV